MGFESLYLAGFALAFGLSVALTYWLRELAPSLGLLNMAHGARHVHAEPTAQVGGIAMFLAFAATVLAFVLAHATGLARGFPRPSAMLYPTILGAAAMHLVGLWDDRVDLSPRAKGLWQAAIAVVVFFGGVRLLSVQLPFLGVVSFSFWPSLVLTVLWLVGITNAFNLVDGVDGLAGGAALFATLALFVASLVFGNYPTALLLLIAAAAILGFLYFNFPPASVFMGDSGSLFLGFLLAGLGLASSSKAATAVAIAIPVVTLGLPVLDTLLAMLRRVLRGAGLSKADRGHIHHRLIELGHSPRSVALILYAACGLFGLSSLILLSEDGRVLGLTFAVIGLTVWFGIQRLRIPELLELRMVIDRGMQQRQLIAANVVVRECVSRLDAAQDLGTVFHELARSLEHSTFEQAEIWLGADYLWPSAEDDCFREIEPTGDGYLWYWRKVPNEETDLRKCWETKLPFLDGSGEQVGRLTLRRQMTRNMPTELRAIADQLLPQVAAAMERLRVGSGGGTRSPIRSARQVRQVV